MSRGGGAAVDFLPFAKLTQVALAPRVRGLLEGIYQLAWPSVDAGLERALDELDRELFRQAERAPNVNEQNRSFEGLREFRRHRGDFQQSFRDALQRSMLALLDRQIQDESLNVVKSKTGKLSELSLVDPSELEEELALSEIAAKAEIRASGPLQYLSYRFGVIAASAPIELEQLPLGPHKLCAALRAAARRFDVVVAQRVLLYRHADRALLSDPVALYDSINRFLIEQRVFPRLQLARRAATAQVATAPAPPVEAPRPPPAPATAVAETPAVAEAAAPPPVAPAQTERPAQVPPESSAVQAFQQLLDSSGTEQQRPHVSRSGGETALDAQFFSTLRELLAGRRHGSHAEHAKDPGRPQAETQDLQAVLTVLQTQPASPVMVGGKWVNRSIGHIKQDMLNQLRSLSDSGTPPRLREEDSDTIDLVGFLFDHLLADYRPNSMSHGLMSRLQVPLLKVALKDKSFFTRRSHPARQLLNSIAETSAYWIEDEDQDRPVIEKMQMVVDRVIKEFDDDITVFDRLFDDLNRHIGSLQKKAEVAERRHVEAAKGREKLELARAAAQESVQQRMFEREPPAAVKTLLESAWTDAIALALLRQGVDSPKTRERLALVDQLVDAFIPGRAPAAQRRTLDDLRPSLEEGLAAVGFHEGAISTTWEDITRLVESDQAHTHAAAADSISEIIAQKPRLGEEARPAAPAPVDTQATEPTGNPAPATGGTILQTLRKAERIPVGPREQAMIDRIKQLPFGTWFEFTINQQGETARRKLCWFSPVTGRCLFLNSRGARAEERMIDQLARDLLRGNAKVVEEHSENLIDRAWKGIMNMFKGVGLGKGSDPNVAIAEG